MKFCQIYTHCSYGKVEMIDFQRCPQCTELASHQLWQIQPPSLMLEPVCTSSFPFFLLSPPPQAFAIPGQYTFAHQDVSMFFWVTDICPVDMLLPTPSELPLHPLFTLLCKDKTLTLVTTSSRMYWLKCKWRWDAIIICRLVVCVFKWLP